MQTLLLVPLVVMALTACAGHLPQRSSGHDSQLALAYVENGHANQVLDLYRPLAPGPHPLMLVIHGGGWSGGERGDMDKFVERLLTAGYAVANLGYRFAPEFRFPAQTEDIASAHAFLLAQAQAFDLDPARVGVFGYSAGGHLALMLGLADARTGPPLKAVVSGAGPSDVTRYTDSPYLRRLIGEYEGNKAAYRQASPRFLASPDDPPTLLYHGTWDRLVEIEQSRIMAAALEAVEVETRLIEVSAAGHATNYLFDRGTWAEVQAFLDRHVMGLPAAR